jgi:hypothetical protein
MTCADCGRDFVPQHRYCQSDEVRTAVLCTPQLRERLRAWLLAFDTRQLLEINPEMTKILADYCFERDAESDLTTREVRVWSTSTRFDETFATIARTDQDYDMFTVPVGKLQNVRVVD